MKRSVMFLGAVGAALAGPGLAADRTITTAVTTPVKTSDPDGSGTPGNLTISNTGSITIGTAGPALTLDGNNTSISIEADSATGAFGTVANTTASGAVGVQILGGITGSFTSVGTINLTGTGGPNYGILVGNLVGAGGDTFTGSISSTGNISVQGSGSVGFLVRTPIIGDITLGGVGAVGEGASGAIIAGPITGAYKQTTYVGALGTVAPDNTKLDPQSGWGLAFGAGVSGGILLDGPITADSTVTASTVESVGSKPALYISPLISGIGGNIEIGKLDNTDTPDRSLVARGTITANGRDPGISATAARIEGGDYSGASHLVLLPYGIANSGTIAATANSSNSTATNTPATSANATALVIGKDGIIGTPGDDVSDLNNTGTIRAQVGLTDIFNIGNKGGTATGLLIEEGGRLEYLNNTATIDASATTSDGTVTDLKAYAIRDLSGTLNRITNSGTISATGTATDSGTTLVAADLSKGTDVKFMNTGSITGNLIFGKNSATGTNTFLQSASGTASAPLTSGRISSAGGDLNVAITAGTLRSDSVTAKNFGLGIGTTLEVALNKTTSKTSPLISASEEAIFEDGSILALTPTSFLPQDGTYVIARANKLTYGDVTESTLPFLISGSGSGISTGGVGNNDLLLTIKRRSAAELGMVGNTAAIYEAAVGAAALDDTFGSSLLLLTNAQEARQTIDTLVPNIGGGARALAVAATDLATGPIGTRQRAVIAQPKQGLGFWTQEFFSNINQRTTAESASFFGSGLGLSMGAEWGDAPPNADENDHTIGRSGLGYTYFAGQVTESEPRSTKADVSLHMASIYSAMRWQDFYIAPQANAGIGFFTGRRTAVAPGFVRDLEGRTTRDPQGTMRHARGDWTAYMASGGITAGYIFHFGPVQVIPQISADALYMHQTGYTETGGGDGINLDVGSQDARSFRVFAGVTAQSPFAFEGGYMLPQILAGWSHEFITNPATIDASFEALPGSSFALVGPQADPSKLIGGAGFSYVFENWSAGVNYDATHTSGSLAQSATISLTSKF